MKHENHTPTGAFEVRGDIVYLQHHVASAGAGRPHSSSATSVTLVCAERPIPA